MRRRAVGLALAAALAGCGGDGVKTFTDPHGALRVKSDQEFRIALRENPSTGYRWQFTEHPNPAVARVVGSRFKLDENAENRAGAGGTRTISFRAGRRGQTEMTLVYVFSGGERGRRPADTRRLTIRVG